MSLVTMETGLHSNHIVISRKSGISKAILKIWKQTVEELLLDGPA